MTPLALRRCRPATHKLDDSSAGELLQQLPGWVIAGGLLSKTYHFKTYGETMGFANAVAWIAQREDHHPELVVGYGSCRVEYSTHSVGGLSENDFICAAQIEALLGA